jgi:hypothetical protein
MKAVFLKSAQAELDAAVDYYADMPATGLRKLFCKMPCTRANV